MLRISGVYSYQVYVHPSTVSLCFPYLSYSYSVEHPKKRISVSNDIEKVSEPATSYQNQQTNSMLFRFLLTNYLFFQKI